MTLYEITADNLHRLAETSFDVVGLKERYDLQRLLRSQIEVIAPDTLVIAEEFGDWDESKRRIDLLALDKDANIVVIELKRTDDGGHMELQALRYAAMVSTMSFDNAVEILGRYLTSHGRAEDARKTVLGFLEWEEPDEDLFAKDVRILLASSNFSKELTTAVMWLNKRQLDIRCIRITPYQDNGRVLLDVQQVVPLPEATDYIIKIRDKENKGRQERNERSNLRWRFWQGLLEIAKRKTQLHSNISPTEYHWISTGAGIGGVSYNYVIRQHGGTVEVFFGRKDGAANKQMFDELHSHKREIEQSFGEELSWERLDGKLGSKIAHHVEVGGYQDPEQTWTLAQNGMVDAMIKLERSIKPFLARL
jgi:hypothetical protein